MATIRKIIYAFVLLGIAYFPLFHKLDVWSLRKWDEARNAVGAINMIQSGDYLVRQYNGNLDTWETKPPLLLWFQAVSIKVFGANMFAIRLPSALSTLFLLLSILFFCGKILNDYRAGFWAALALLVSDGFIKAHVSRTGDHDALLSSWLILSVFYFYKYLIDNKLKNILAATFFTFLAVMTKSVIGLMFLPALFLYLFIYPKNRHILRGGAIYASFSALVLAIVAYYFLADYTHKGYLEAVWKMELLPRFQNKEGKYLQPEAWHYLKILVVQHRFPLWFLLPFALWAALKSRNEALRQFVSLPLSIGIFFSLVMSFGIWYDWYDAPLYPLWALIFGCGMSAFFERIEALLPQKHIEYSRFLLFLGLSIAFFARPYYKVAERIAENHNVHKPNEQYGEFVEKRERDGQNCDFTMLFSNLDAYDAPMQFYEKTRKMEGKNLNLLYFDLRKDLKTELLQRDSLQKGSVCLSCHFTLNDSIKKYFDIQILEQTGDCLFLRIGDKKVL